jgi:glycosyltransferase involved in cell wall biosynthesis
MRLLLITPEFPPHVGGGISKFYAEMARAWREAGVDVSVLVASPFGSFPDSFLDDIPVYFAQAKEVEAHFHNLQHLAAVPLLRRWIAAGHAACGWLRSNTSRFDAIETVDYGLLFAPLLCLADRPPVAVTLHGSIGQLADHEPVAPPDTLTAAIAQMIEGSFLQYADALRTHSPSNAKEWSARLSRNVALVPAPLGVSTAASRPDYSSQYQGLVVGRIQSWKGPDLLCRALVHLERRLPDAFQVAWVGRDTATAPDGGSLSGWLTTHYPEIWGKRIVLLGQLPPDRVSELQRAIRLSIVPSLWDTFNYSVAESMGSGCVTLCSTAAGASYLVEHGINGFRFSPEEPSDLAQLLQHAWSLTASEHNRIGQAANATIQRALHPDVSAVASLSGLSDIRDAAPSVPSAFLQRLVGFGMASGDSADDAHLAHVSIRRLASHLTHRIADRLVG